METLFCKNREEWRLWLEKNHVIESEIWLIYFKKHTKKPTVIYNEAVEEALCFGWIDSIVKRIDNDAYMQKFSPRKKNSVWSLINTERVKKMISAGKMTKHGLELVEIAKKNGQWEKAYSSKTKQEAPKELIEKLKTKPTALKNFYNFSPSYQSTYVRWILSAKRAETTKKRIKVVVDRCEKNLKPGMM